MAGTFRYAARVRDGLLLLCALPMVLMVKISPARSVITVDVERWMQEWGHTRDQWQGWLPRLVWLSLKFPEFRNLLYYRVEMEPCLWARGLLVVVRFMFKPRESLFFYTPVIGTGLFIEHGFSTVIAARKIGKNCWINQQVTIGYSNKTDCPEIGDNVRIAAGAKVLGAISVGDNVTVGANSVVCRDVPAHCTVVGVPARIIRRGATRVDEKL